MQLELMGPVIHILKVMPRAIANGPNCPQPLHAHTTSQTYPLKAILRLHTPSSSSMRSDIHLVRKCQCLEPMMKFRVALLAPSRQNDTEVGSQQTLVHAQQGSHGTLVFQHVQSACSQSCTVNNGSMHQLQL